MALDAARPEPNLNLAEAAEGHKAWPSDHESSEKTRELSGLGEGERGIRQ
jgi:hypothetical protein